MTCYKNIAYGPSITVDAAGTVTGSTTANVIIPATGKSKLNIIPVLAEDNVQVSHYHYELTFESLIYSANQVLADLELEIQRIKTILCTPGLRLNIFPVGLGFLPVINGVDVTSIPDLTGGPFCDNLSVQGLASNNAILVSGTFRFDITHCSPYFSKNLVQYTSGIEYEVDEEGNISFIVETMYQSRIPMTDKTLIKTLGAEISKTVGKVFVGFKRKTKLAFTRDQRIARIRTELREIPSDAAFAPFTKHIDFTDDLESSLADGGEFAAGGFNKWTRNMSCTITLPQRVNKIWAWYVFRNLVLHRLKGVKSFIKLPNIVEATPPANQVADLATDERNKAWYLLTKFKISNPLFSRTISFEAEYLFTMSLSGILAGAANMFATVRHNIAPKLDGLGVPIVPHEFVIFDPNATADKDLSQEWEYWNEGEDKNLTSIYEFIDSGPIVYAQCAVSSVEVTPNKLGITSTKTSFNEQEPTKTPDSKLRELTGLYKEAAKSWITYKNNFQIIQSNNNELVDYIQDVVPQTYQAQEADSPISSTVGFRINHENSGTDAYVKPATVNFGTATNRIRMKGFALRVGYEIPCPAVIAIAGAAVSRIGEALFEHQTVAVSSVLGPSLEGTSDDTTLMPVYLCMWDVTYAVNNNIKYDDILSQIKSSANPGAFT